MDEKLIEYIEKRMELGHEIEEIKKTLQEAGHDISVIEQHLNHVMNRKNVEEKMKEFIKKHMKRGVGKDKIREYLVNAGHREDVVEKNINNAIRKRKNSQIIRLSFGIGIIVATVIILYLFGFGGKSHTNIAEKQFADSNLSILSPTEPLSPSGAPSVKEECDQACKDKPLLDKAIVTRDITICNDLKDPSSKTWCQDFLKG